MTTEAVTQPDLSFKRWEKALMLASAALFAAALALYVAQVSFLPQSSGAMGARIGTISSAQGSVRRETSGADAFDPIASGGAVFEGDLVVTAPDARAVIDLGASTLEVEPGSMIRLAFDSGFSLSGISRFGSGARRVQVDVVVGGVSRKSGQVRLLERGRSAGAEGVHVAPLPVVPPPPVAAAPEVLPPPVPEEAPRPVVAPERVEAPPEVAALPSAAPAPLAPDRELVTASPSPAAASIPEIRKLRFLEPKVGARLRVPDGSPHPQAVASVRFIAQPAGVPLQMSLHRLTRLESGEIQREQVFTQDLVTSKAPAKITHALDTPGEYEWELRAPGGESIASAAGTPTTHAFTVEPRYVGVKVENPLVGGEESASNRLHGRILRNFDIRLRWKPVPDAESYRVWIGPSPGAKKALLEKDVGQETSLSLNKGKVLKGRLYYQVQARLPKGYVAVSPMSTLIFDFLPPKLVDPAEGEAVKRKSLDEGAIVYTWEATNFTEAYLFELASDPKFTKVLETERVEENFRVGPAPNAGRWFWRVKSLGKEIESAPSQPHSFRID